ncbi:unnamed protein product [Lampetra fluviatilis]
MSKTKKKGFIKRLKNIFCCFRSVSDYEVYEPGSCVPSSAASHETSPVATNEKTEVASLEASPVATNEMGLETSREVDAVDNREMSLVASQERIEVASCEASPVENHEMGLEASRKVDSADNCEIAVEDNHEMGLEASRKVDPAENSEISFVTSCEMSLEADQKMSPATSCEASLVANKEMSFVASLETSPLSSHEASQMSSHGPNPVADSGANRVADHGPSPVVDREPSPAEENKASRVASHGDIRAAINKAAECKGCQATSHQGSPGCGSGQAAGHGQGEAANCGLGQAAGQVRRPRRRGGKAARRKGSQHTALGSMPDHRQKDAITSTASAIIRPTSKKLADPPVLDKIAGEDKIYNGAPRLAPESGENLSLTWQWNACEGAGLDNMGNTCFLNATLQCLTYTAPLANYLISRHHSGRCTDNGCCMMCIMERHTIATFSSKGKVIKPLEIVHNLKRIAKHLQFGKQEDVHEFFCYIIEALHLSCPINHKPEEHHMEKTSVIHQIFTGQLRSTVECKQCSCTSDTFENCLDISLHINNSPDMLAAFADFTKTETLDEYTCQRCCCKVKATKRMSLHHLPNVLALSIKRYDLFGKKINRDCPYPQHLDVRPFMSQQEDADPVVYRLYSVLVHSGKCSTEGHYYCYNKICDGRWFRMDDDLVTPVDTRVVMKKQAYILFYVRLSGRASP